MNYHEPVDEQTKEARDIHRALNSFIEEVEAVDWYHQRVVTATDNKLKEILAHNRDEEIEHAVMLLEWLRRHGQPGWDEELRTYLFTDKNILEVEEEEEGEESSEQSGELNVGSLKNKKR